MDFSAKSKLSISIIIILVVFLIILYICGTILSKTNNKVSECNCEIKKPIIQEQTVQEKDVKIEREIKEDKIVKVRKNRLCLYYADWCGYSRQFLPIWKNLKSEILSSNLKQKVVLEEYECDKDKEKCNGVGEYPTVILHKENGENKEYQGQREKNEILGFIKSNI